MILADRDIKKYIEEGKIIVEPLPRWEKQLGACSLDLRLGKINKIRYVLKPREFCLGITQERIEVSNDICGILHGRSSLGRQGLMIHSTAPLIEAGFRGKIVLELYNVGTREIQLTPGMRICAISFEKLLSPAKVPYYKKKSAKYKDQDEEILK